VERFIDNPRRFPRLPARLRVLVAARGDGFGAETEDLGPGGCLLVSPRPLARGAQLRLAIEGEGVRQPLSVLGRVAWAEAAVRQRAGVAFETRQPGEVRPAVWFQQLLAAQPGMASRLSSAPSRLPAEAPLYLLPPPRHIFDLDGDEEELLMRLENGVTPRALLDARPERAGVTVRVLFSLFEKRALTLSLGQSAPAWQWRQAISRGERAGALDESLVTALERPPAPPGHEAFRAMRERPHVAPAAPPEQPPVLRRETAAPDAPPVLRRQAPRPPPEAPPALRREPPRPLPDAAAPAARRHDPQAAPRASRLARSPEAQRCLDLARDEAGKGNFHAAIALLRRALQLAPRDPEVSELLGRLAFARDS
jgi:hypothetical protein